jgi:glycosyltransferase involved in cell wall biosynthesis
MSVHDPARVLHLAAGNLYGGVERIVGECARLRALAPAMTPVVVVAFEGRLAREIEESGTVCHVIGGVRASRPATVWRARRTLADLLRREQPDWVVCHSSWSYAWSAPILRASGVQRALWLHDRITGRTWIERWARRIDPDLIISNSRYTDEAAAAVFPRARREVVYAPVAPGGAVSRDDRRALRESLGARASTCVIAIASRFEQWKGHGALIDALAGADGDWQLWIAGAPQRAAEAEYRAQLARKAEANGIAARTRWLGERRDIPAVLRAADVLCQPNTGPEPFGVTFVEALYAGLPVVATACGGALEIVTPDCGVLVPPGDPAALKNALSHLVRDEQARQTLGAAGPARATQLCDPRRQLETLASTLAAVVSA